MSDIMTGTSDKRLLFEKFYEGGGRFLIEWCHEVPAPRWAHFDFQDRDGFWSDVAEVYSTGLDVQISFDRDSEYAFRAELADESCTVAMN